MTANQLLKSLQLAIGEGYGDAPVIVMGDNKDDWHEADAVGVGDGLSYNNARGEVVKGRAVRVHP